MAVRQNERSWAISLISDINIALQALNLKIKRAGGEATISEGKQRMFPDVLLYADVNQTQIIQGWELKLPDNLITDETFIKDAQRKANHLGLNSCFIWNFTAGVLYVKDKNGIFKIKKQWNDTNNIRTRKDVETRRSQWLEVIKDILLEINEYIITGDIRSLNIGDAISDNTVSAIIGNNTTILAEKLKKEAVRNSIIGAYIGNWWNEVKQDILSGKGDEFIAYAKTILLHWTNRIIFAHFIKSKHNFVYEVDNIDYETTPPKANTIFEEITSKCDFYNIFSSVRYNDILPEITWQALVELSLFLKNNGITHIQQSSLQTILEKTVALTKREINGQFTTPENLADILVKITVIDWIENIIDPCCGTGTISKAVLNNKKEKTGDVKNSIETAWASDKFEFPLQIASMSMADYDSINLPNMIFADNAFDLTDGKDIEIINPENGEVLDFNTPLFGAIVSNLPFVPFENIAVEDKIKIADIANEVFNNTKIRLSGKCDYYSYIIFSLWKIAKTDARIGLITSNSWLGTDSGQGFYSALNQYFKITQIHTSSNGRWFNNAKVVTTIMVLEKRNEITPPKFDEMTAFVKWNKPLEKLAGADKDVLINTSLLNKEIDADVAQLKIYSNAKFQELTAMSVSSCALFHDVDWLLDIEDKLVPITKVLKVMRGERRGWDAMFYPESGHNIEPCYIKKVLKNTRTVYGLTALPDNDAFCCSETLAELNAKGHSGVINWINKFENSFNEVGRPLPQVLAKANMHWYEMNDNSTADIVTTMNPDQRLFYAKFDTPSFINQRLIGLKRKDGYDDIPLYHALLNSILGMFYIEAVGFGRGMGALDISSTSIKSAYMLNPEVILPKQRIEILDKFAPLVNREVMNTVVEFEMADRITFDKCVLKAYGIEEYYDRIKQALLSMQQMRLSVR